MKLFDKWDSEKIEVKDLGIKGYINLDSRIVAKSSGRHAKQQFYKSKLHIVERLINKLFVSGHRGKKHKIYSGHNVGKSFRTYTTVKKAFEIIEKKTNKNPIEVFVRSIENSSPIEEVISYQKGGIFAREAIVTSPQRRVDLALKHIAQGTFQKSSRNKKKACECLAEEIIAASDNDPSSFAVSQRITSEKEAIGAR